MENPTRRTLASEDVNRRVIALQDALTRLWASVVAVEVVDEIGAGVCPQGREDVLQQVLAASQEWHEGHVALEDAVAEWVTAVGESQYEVASGAALLQEIFPPAGNGVSVTFLTDQEAVLDTMRALDDEGEN